MVVAAAAGNLLEWYDFAAYGFFAAIIGKLYFPSGNATTSLLAALAVFGVAFVMRPAGGFVLGRFADRAGRRPALTLSVLMMGVSTTLIACLPTYAGVGLLAPVLLVFLRCVQGFSAGGEYAGAATYLIEYAPRNRRGLWSSVISATAALGVLVAGLTALLLSAWLSEAELTSWGWRVPFLLAAPLSLAGLYVRFKLDDTPVYRELERHNHLVADPLKQVGKKALANVAMVFACTAVAGLGFYYLATYVITHLTVVVGLDRTTALLIAIVGLAIYSVLCPVAGLIGDRIGRRRTMIVGGLGLAAVAVPAFAMLSSGGIWLSLGGLAVFALFEALVNVMLGVLLVELFPANTRVSGSAVGFNLAQAIIGGPGPLVAAALAASFDTAVAPAFYMTAVALISTVVLLRFLPETLGNDLVDGSPSMLSRDRKRPEAVAEAS